MLALILLVTASFCSANSRGIGVPCDVDVTVGSSDVMVKDETKSMWWTLKAVWSPTRYSLRSGDGAVAQDSKTYTPGRWNEIYLRSLAPLKQFTGLVLYAVNAQGAKVGEWAIPAGAAFHQPGECVVHKDANKKRYLETFRFRVPAGTGTVTIKALVKYGLANPNKDGFFAWPNSAHLTLTEGPSSAAVQTWFTGNVGESCTATCTRNGGGACDLAALQAAGSSPELYASVKTVSTCTLPMMAGCSGASPAISDEGCFFHDSTCQPPAPPEVPSRACTVKCGNWGNGGYKVGQCCIWTQNTNVAGGAMIGKCMCVTDGDSVYSEYNGGWALGQQPGETNPPTPAPPKPEQITCDAKITWDSNARRLCACSNGKITPTMQLTASPAKAPTAASPTNPPKVPTKFPTKSPVTRAPAAAGKTAAPSRRPPAPTPAPPTPPPPTPVGGCSNFKFDGDNCESNPGCCASAGNSCYEKDEFWASCRPTGTCIPGIYDKDPIQYRTPWTCRLLGADMIPTMPPVAAAVCTRMITVKIGDTMNTIAAEQCTTVQDILANNLNFDPDFLAAGNQLKVPCPTCAPTNAPPATTPSASGATRGYPSALLAMLLGTLSTVSSGPKPGSKLTGFLVLIGMFLCLPSANAHNWLTSPARGNEAGENNGFNGFTSPPCPQKTARIHAQVGAGQKFPIEWAAGHGFGSYTYFAVMRAKDETNMQKHDFKLLDDYLANAPATDYLKEYPVVHVSHELHSSALLQSANIASTYTWVPGMAATTGARPAGFRNFGKSPTVQGKTAAGTKADLRAKYTNPKYPWLISVHKFTMLYDFPNDADSTMFEIPTDAGPGKYVIQYLWSGYYDCIDLNVLDVPSTDIWGSGGGSSGYDRTDHCSFIERYDTFKITSTCQAIKAGEDVAKCANLCSAAAGCDAIQVVSTRLDAKVLAAGVYSGTTHVNAVCTALAATSEFVCYGLHQGTPNVGPSYEISADPEDPIFYNSCFKKSAGWTYAQVCASCPPTALEPGWAFGQHCISCNEMRINAVPGGIVPKWDFVGNASECRHCGGLG